MLGAEEIEQESLNLTGKTPQEIISWAFANFTTDLYQMTSFGLTGMVIMDMISKLHPGEYPIPVIFIDTLHHFKETIDLMENAAERYKAKVHIFRPKGCISLEEFKAKHNDQLWIHDADKYGMATLLTFRLPRQS